MSCYGWLVDEAGIEEVTSGIESCVIGDSDTKELNGKYLYRQLKCVMVRIPGSKYLQCGR